MATQTNFFHILITSLLLTLASSYQPPPDVTNLDHIIESSVCSNQTPFLALILVISHAGNLQRRLLTRATYPASELNQLGFRRVFVIATFTRANSMHIQENERFNDLLQLNYTEDYRKLTLKSLAAFAWASKQCIHTQFIVKTDDDIFLEYYSIFKYFRSISREEVNVIRGCKGGGTPTRDSLNYKRYTSYDMYPLNNYPAYLVGMFYVTSPKTLSLLVYTARSVPFLNLEDVYFTGLVAQKAGVEMIDICDKVRRRSSSLKCCIGKGRKVYECQYFVAELVRPLTRYLASRLKRRGVFCYRFGCENLSANLSEKMNLKCR